MTIENTPNAGKLINSLRNLGYDNYSAIEDILDNSIDAEAKNLKIKINTVDKDLQITIIDDGLGMDWDTLDQALRLGSNTEKDELSDLGKFGMGLCTASISMAKRLEVITRQKDGEYLYSSQDLDEVVKNNSFIKELRKATKEEISIFNEYNLERGTIIKISKTDHVTNTNSTIFIDTLVKKIGQTFRKFIDAGIKFSINEKEIRSINPLMEDRKETEVYSDEEYTIKIDDKSERIRIKIVVLPDYGQEKNNLEKINMHNQGFYVLRNNREITYGQTLGIFTKHPTYNRLRMEISFSSSLDNDMGVRFTKDGVNPKQNISDFLKQEIGGQISTIRSRIIKEKKADESMQVDHKESEEIIAKKSKLLIIPDAIIEQRSKKTNSSDKKEEMKDVEDRERIPRHTKLSKNGIGVRFDTVSQGANGLLYDCFQEGKLIIIQWNVDHPFYDKMILSNKENKDITNAIDFLVYALASAELKTTHNDSVEVLQNIKIIMSANLRALLS